MALLDTLALLDTPAFELRSQRTMGVPLPPPPPPCRCTAELVRLMTAAAELTVSVHEAVDAAPGSVAALASELAHVAAQLSGLATKVMRVAAAASSIRAVCSEAEFNTVVAYVHSLGLDPTRRPSRAMTELAMARPEVVGLVRAFVEGAPADSAHRFRPPIPPAVIKPRTRRHPAACADNGLPPGFRDLLQPACDGQGAGGGDGHP